MPMSPSCLQTPPEVIAGSTRMGAGTAQKIALNMLSTLIGIHLGHVHDGLMVNLRADNDKLRGRAARIVCGDRRLRRAEAARAALENGGGSVKPAILLAAGAARSAERREGTARRARGQKLRPALCRSSERKPCDNDDAARPQPKPEQRQNRENEMNEHDIRSCCLLSAPAFSAQRGLPAPRT